MLPAAFAAATRSAQRPRGANAVRGASPTPGCSVRRRRDVALSYAGAADDTRVGSDPLQAPRLAQANPRVGCAALFAVATGLVGRTA